MMTSTRRNDDTKYETKDTHVDIEDQSDHLGKIRSFRR
jgi:hypothetical protein